MINPFRWSGVVETRDFFETVPVDSATPEVDPRNQATIYYKPAETDVTLAAIAHSPPAIARSLKNSVRSALMAN